MIWNAKLGKDLDSRDRAATSLELPLDTVPDGLEGTLHLRRIHSHDALWSPLATKRVAASSLRDGRRCLRVGGRHAGLYVLRLLERILDGGHVEPVVDGSVDLEKLLSKGRTHKGVCVPLPHLLVRVDRLLLDLLLGMLQVDDLRVLTETQGAEDAMIRRDERQDCELRTVEVVLGEIHVLDDFCSTRGKVVVPNHVGVLVKETHLKLPWLKELKRYVVEGGSVLDQHAEASLLQELDVRVLQLNEFLVKLVAGEGRAPFDLSAKEVVVVEHIASLVAAEAIVEDGGVVEVHLLVDLANSLAAICVALAELFQLRV